jgi:hypothetical protein
VLGIDNPDLRTPNELSIYFRDRVMAEAVVQYDSNFLLHPSETISKFQLRLPDVLKECEVNY